MTQKEALRGWFDRGRSITAAQANSELGITQLSARIIELEADGYRVAKERKQVKGRYGKTSVVEYRKEETV